MRSVIVGIFAIGITTLAAAPARAESGTVFYKDGGRVSGELVEVHPGKFVVVKLSTGETRRIEWAEMDHVGEAAAAAPAAPAAPPVDEAELATIVFRSSEPNTVLQEITGHATGTGYGSQGGSVTVHTTMYQDLCTAPCSYKLKLGLNELMASGPGYPTAIRALSLHPGENYVYAKMGSGWMVLGGYTALTIGIAGITCGVVALLLNSPSSYGGDRSSFLMPLAIGGLAGGAVLTGGGIALMVLGASWLGPDPEHPEKTSGLPTVRGIELAGKF